MGNMNSDVCGPTATFNVERNNKSQIKRNRYNLIQICIIGLLIVYAVTCLSGIIHLVRYAIGYAQSKPNSSALFDKYLQGLFSSFPDIMTIASGLICVALLFYEQKKYKWTKGRVISLFIIVFVFHAINCLISLFKFHNIFYGISGMIMATISCVVCIIPPKVNVNYNQLKYIYNKMPHNKMAAIQLYNVYDNKSVYTIEYLDSCLKERFEANVISRMTLCPEAFDRTVVEHSLRTYNSYLSDPTVEKIDNIENYLQKSKPDQIKKLNALDVQNISKTSGCNAYCLLLEKLLSDRLSIDKILLEKGEDGVSEKDHDRSSFSSNLNYISSDSFVDSELVQWEINPDIAPILLKSCKLDLLPAILLDEGYFYSFKHGGEGVKSPRRYVAFKVNLNYNNGDKGKGKYLTTLCIVIFDRIAKDPCSDKGICSALMGLKDNIQDTMECRSVG